MDRISLGPNNEVVRIIEGHGIGIWFEPVSGFNLALYREFYQKLRVVDEDSCVLRTNVRGEIIDVTPYLIATLMKYESPVSRCIHTTSLQ